MAKDLSELRIYTGIDRFGPYLTIDGFRAAMPSLAVAGLIAEAPAMLAALRECALFITMLGLDSEPAAAVAAQANKIIARAAGERGEEQL